MKKSEIHEITREVHAVERGEIAPTTWLPRLAAGRACSVKVRNLTAAHA